MLRNIDPERANAYDDYARAITTITEPHRMNHDGFMYHASGKITGLANLGVQDFLIVTAALNFPHVQRARMDFGGGNIDIQSYEGTTTTDDGSAITINNTNRNSSNTPDLTYFTGPTVSAVGDLIHTGWAVPTANGIGQTAQGISTVDQGEEWILKPSTKYLIRVTNNSGAEIEFRYELLFYEIDY